MYALHRNGRITGRPKTLPAGELVFTNEDGLPILVWNCGNPVTRALELAKPIRKLKAMAPPKIEVAAVPPQELVPSLVTLPEAGLPEVATANPIAILPTIEGGAVPMVGASVGSSSAPLWFLPLLALGGDHHNPPVPEAGSLSALAIGLTTLGASFLRQKRARR